MSTSLQLFVNELETLCCHQLHVMRDHVTVSIVSRLIRLPFSTEEHLREPAMEINM
ncbi:uncharacterized protein LOC143153459 isoform X2 [Ptiloglossa arizonensis]|uniref:uncharacterized protein LOC143153459 isoform X2 n=1 Tax=Ptiloglossa arizonensis TaxID=3350558 RepID=UPI003FA09CAD